ncbi:MAG: phenylalanine--tRNA ligase subunit alpha, partial [Nanoarchaeota archaeon]
MENLNEIFESLSQNELKILLLLKEKSINEICKKSNLDKVSVLRALEFLQNKKIIELKKTAKKMIILGVNGILYKKIGLPERRLLTILDSTKNILSLEETKKSSRLSDNEFQAALGALKKKAMIDIKNGKIILTADKKDIGKKMLEERFIEEIPLDSSTLSSEQTYSLKALQNRKEIIEIKDKNLIQIKVTDFGEEIINNSNLKKEKLLEQVTSELIKSQDWRGKKFRRYDVTSSVPKIYGGKRHFVNQTIDYAREIWTNLGFEEMSGSIIQNSFWNFDALFTAQDHPVRELQDTFYLNKNSEIQEKKLVEQIKNAHEKGVGNSKGWQYSWNEEDAKKLVLRTHTTVLSALKLFQLSKMKEKNGKYFAIGKCFRNETVDWSHGFEFNQTEGIVIDKNANFNHLLGYLKEFFSKMGFNNIRFTPAYFPYTEPSVEIHWFHPEKKIWLELGGAGMF